MLRLRILGLVSVGFLLAFVALPAPVDKTEQATAITQLPQDRFQAVDQ